jgi:hypothetical protein
MYFWGVDTLFIMSTIPHILFTKYTTALKLYIQVAHQFILIMFAWWNWAIFLVLNSHYGCFVTSLI